MNHCWSNRKEDRKSTQTELNFIHNQQFTQYNFEKIAHKHATHLVINTVRQQTSVFLNSCLDIFYFWIYNNVFTEVGSNACNEISLSIKYVQDYSTAEQSKIGLEEEQKSRFFCFFSSVWSNRPEHAFYLADIFPIFILVVMVQKLKLVKYVPLIFMPERDRGFTN